MTATVAKQEKTARSEATAFYEPKITNATDHIAAIRAHEDALLAEKLHWLRLAGCEAERAVVFAHSSACM